MRRLNASAWAALLTAAASGASFGDSDAPEGLVSQNTYELGIAQGRLDGPGADWLRREGGAADFVVLGEPHNSTDVPKFTAALFRMLHNTSGFDALALEQGPCIMMLLAAAAESGGVDRVFDAGRDRLDALQFRTAEELTMIADVVKEATNGTDSIWGIDRELAVTDVLREIAGAGEGDVSVAAAELYDRATEANAHHIGAQRFMVAHTDEVEAFGSRWRELGGTSGPLAELLYRSAHNIALFKRGDNESRREGTADREAFLQKQFMDRLNETEAQSGGHVKVLLKLGHQHCGKTGRDGDFASLGASVDALARERDGHALFINIQILNPPGKYWSLTENPEYRLISAAGSLTEWRLIDVRPLRHAQNAGEIELNATVSDLVNAFDAVLLLGGADRGSMKWLIKSRSDRGTSGQSQ